MPKVLITGGAGFLGSHMIEHLLRETDWELVSLDRLDTSGNLNRLTDMDIWDARKQRVRVVWHDLKGAISSQLAKQIGDVDIILHLAASSHVDRSIDDPMSFVMDNVVGTCHVLEYARQLQGLQSMVYFSTDEVFGPALEAESHSQIVFTSQWDTDFCRYQEWDRYHSGNPYAASKAGAEELCLAYHNTYKLPVLITHCMNIIGQRQHPEKFVPSTIRKIMRGAMVTIHADPTRTRPGSRFYIHARNVAAAVLFLLRGKGQPGDKYNIVGEREVDNLQMAELISRHLGIPLRFELVDFHSSRPGHDLRYALDGSKMAALGWAPPVNFEESLRATVQWYVKHPEWLEG